MSPRNGSGWRRRLSTLLALSLTATGISLGVQAASQSASATHPVVTGKAVCNTQTGKYDVTWTISGDIGYPNETATIKTQSRLTTPTLVGKTVKGSGTITGAETGLSAGTYSQTVQVQWTNHRAGDLVSQTGKVVTGSGYCKQSDVKDASASVSITPATCDSPEKLVLGTATNATWRTPTRTTGPGDYSVVATGNAGPPQHLFADGSKTKTFTGTLAGKDTSRNCWAKDAAASVTVTPPSCTAIGIASLVGLANATLVGTLDQTVGTHTATFKADAGHLFSNGSDTLQVSYKIVGSGSTTGDPECAPPDKVTYTEWKDGTWACGDTTVTQTRTVTTASYTWDPESKQWVVRTSSAIIETRVRNLTQQEIGTCPVTPPKNAPLQVKGAVKKLDKCGLNNFFFAKKVKGAHYVVRGKVVREGVWLKTKTKTVKVKVVADSANYKVVGKQLFVVKFPNNRSCGIPPHKPPRTGLSVS